MQRENTLLEQPHERLFEVLSTLLMQTKALQTLVETAPAIASTTPELQEGLHELELMARSALDITRSTPDTIPVAELDGITLAEALSQRIEEMAETLDLSSRISVSGLDNQGHAPGGHTLSSNAERLLYLVAREALYQVQYHTNAHRLRLILSYNQDEVQMSIEDDGMSLQHLAAIDEDDELPAPPFTATSRDTLASQLMQNLRSRIEQLDGVLTINQTPEQGTRVTALLPYIQRSQSTERSSSADETNTHSASQPIRILVVDRQAVIRAGLQRLLDSYADFRVVGQAADGVQAVSETLELGPQVVLMDSLLPEGQSIEALRQIKQLNLEARVLMLSTQDREDYLYETLRAGADGYVSKDIVPDELARAIRSVARGEVLLQPQLAGKLLSRFSSQGRNRETLTTREREVLRLLARGLRNKEIAAQLYVSERTVNFHLANIYQKLNVSGRTEALSRALEQGLITP